MSDDIQSTGSDKVDPIIRFRTLVSHYKIVLYGHDGTINQIFFEQDYDCNVRVIVGGIDRAGQYDVLQNENKQTYFFYGLDFLKLYKHYLGRWECLESHVIIEK